MKPLIPTSLWFLLVACGGDGSTADTSSPDTPDTPDIADTADTPDVADTSDAPDLGDTDLDTAESTDAPEVEIKPGPIAALETLEASLLALPEAERDAALTAWIESQPRIPLAENETAVFLWRGPATEVRMVGDATSWNAQTSPRLTRLDVAGVDLWWLAQTYDSASRLDYKLVLDGSDWRLDPLNPELMPGGFGPNSELAMPDYVEPAEVRDLEGTPAGALATHIIESTALSQSRTIHVYVPAGADVEGPRPLVVFHDGNDYRTLIRAQLILDRIVQTGDIGPLVAVFAQPTNRTAEYNRNDAYVSHLADEVVPFVRTTYNAGQSAAVTGTIGPSFGGLIACYVAFKRPEVFGLAGCQSGAFSYDQDAFIDLVRDNARVDIQRLYLVVGTYELAVSGSSTEGNLLEAQRRLVTVLSDKGYTFTAEELPQGHSWGLWRDTLPTALRVLWGAE
ncbi:MAG TPA: alpha/beta hydrolase-fold protein [Myxococcota bacterium]|nr:alpha/beta hydrolase-fold protein [Myxococcota bacterium]